MTRGGVEGDRFPAVIEKFWALRNTPLTPQAVIMLCENDLNKHCLINSLGVLVTETRLGHERPQVGLPPKISPKLPVSV